MPRRILILRLVVFGLAAFLPVVRPVTGLAEELRIGFADSDVAAIDDAARQQLTEQGLTGLAIGVLTEGQLRLTRGYGLADRDAGTPVTSDTVFNWASNSKPVVAVLAMMLAAEGRLDLDADVRQYVPEYPEKAHPVTTRMLLCHQSGIAHYRNGPLVPADGYAPGDGDHDPVVAIGRFSGSPLIFEPGERYSYSSYAYVLLSAVIQRAADQPFADLVRGRIVEPLRLKSFQWDIATVDQPHWSRGYIRLPVAGVLPAPETAHFWKHGAGGFKSSIVDFGRWAEAVLNARLLDDATWQEMQTTPPPRDGSRPTMALGIHVAGQDQELHLWHGGSQREARSWMVVYPRQRLGVVVLSNSSYADMDDIAAALLAVVRDEAAAAPSAAADGN